MGVGEFCQNRRDWWELGCDSLDTLSMGTCEELNGRGDIYKKARPAHPRNMVA